MRRLIASFSVAVIALLALPQMAVAQTDEELRQLYFRKDVARMEQLARDGDPRAQAWMGPIMQQAHRREEAKSWYEQAAVKGNRFALSSLVHIYGFERNDERVLYWERRGADMGIADAQFSVALRHADGRGVPKNDREALRWLAAAADQAHPEACFTLAKRYASGIGVGEDSVQAYALASVAERGLDTSSGAITREIDEFKERLAAELPGVQLQQAKARAAELIAKATANKPR